MEINIYYLALEDLSSLAASSEDSDYPKENLQDRSPETLFKPDTTAAVRIDMDFGASGRAADSLIIGNHDLYTQGSGIKLGWDTSGFPADEGYVIGSGGSYHSAVSGDESIWREHFTEVVAKRYWSLYIDSCTAAFQMGSIFLGVKYTEDVFLPQIRRRQPHVAVDYTDGGTRIANKKGTTKRFRQYRTQSRTATEESLMDGVAEEIDSIYHSVMLYVSSESLLMQSEFVEPYEMSKEAYEDFGWQFALLEIIQA